MRTPKVSDIVGIINKSFPFVLAESWDNVGLQLGDPQAAAGRIMVALDPSPEVVEAALAADCRLLVTHHPLIFAPLRQITAGVAGGATLLRAAAGGLALLAMHTNYDIADNGLNDLLARHLEVTRGVAPLKVTGRDELVKLAVFVPREQLEQVRQALFPYAAPLGNYRNCSFAAPGAGTFLPQEGANPAIGQVGRLEEVAEERLELLVSRRELTRAVKALLKAHPYEEPAFDCYPLLNESTPYGIGRIGRLEQPCRLGDYAARLARSLACNALRMVGDPDRTVSKVALCSGSGGSLLPEAIRHGADLLVTGDLKYHDARDAEAAGIALIDAGHFGTEILMVAAVRALLQEQLEQGGFTAEVLTSAVERDPFILQRAV